MDNDLKILIVIPNYKFWGAQTYFPVGILYVISIIEQCGYEVDVINLNFEVMGLNSVERIQQQLKLKHYDVVGTGGTIFDYDEIKTIFSTVKRIDENIITLLGGRLIHYDSELIFSEFDVDYGIIGDADETLPQLLKKISRKSPEIIENTIYKEEGKIKKGEFRFSKKNIDELPYPNIQKSGYENVLQVECADISSVDFYIEKGWKIYSILSGFNCINNCTFCANSNLSYRKRTEESMIEEMDYAINHYGINVFNFMSDVFSFNWNDIEKLCSDINLLKEKYNKNIYFVIFMRVKGFTEERALLLKKAGCLAVFFGFESYDNNVLASMHKGITSEDINKTVNACKNVNLAFKGFFIFGDIAETKESYKRTLDFWKNNCRGFSAISPIAVFPGTQLLDYCLKENIITDKLKYYKELSKNQSYMLLSRNISSNLTNKEHKKMLNEVFSYSVKYKLYCRHKAKKNKQDNLYTVHYRCGNCGKTNERENVHIQKHSFTILSCPFCGARNNTHPMPEIVLNTIINILSFVTKHWGVQLMRLKQTVKNQL